MTMRCCSLTLTLALSTIIVGCGGDPSVAGRKSVFPVSGTVTYNGAPLSGATVAFAPQSGQPTAVGRTDDAGKYVLTTYDFGDGAAEGPYKVTVNKQSAVASTPDADAGGGAGHEADAEAEASSHAAAAAAEAKSVELVPEQYSRSSTTPLSADVSSTGDNTFDFTLE